MFIIDYYFRNLIFLWTFVTWLLLTKSWSHWQAYLCTMYYVSHYALLRHVPLECRVNIDNCAACLVCGHWLLLPFENFCHKSGNESVFHHELSCDHLTFLHLWKNDKQMLIVRKYFLLRKWYLEKLELVVSYAILFLAFAHGILRYSAFSTFI